MVYAKYMRKYLTFFVTLVLFEMISHGVRRFISLLKGSSLMFTGW